MSCFPVLSQLSPAKAVAKTVPDQNGRTQNQSKLLFIKRYFDDADRIDGRENRGFRDKENHSLLCTSRRAANIADWFCGRTVVIVEG
jgi:hypothetical protein